jgi:hypothetical protein
MEWQDAREDKPSHRRFWPNVLSTSCQHAAAARPHLRPRFPCWGPLSASRNTPSAPPCTACAPLLCWWRKCECSCYFYSC